MRLPNPYSLEETLSKLRHRLATACNEEALALLEKADKSLFQAKENGKNKVAG